MPTLPRPAKIDLEKVLVEMQLTTIRERISYILNTYDRQINFKVKVKLSQLIVVEVRIIKPWITTVSLSFNNAFRKTFMGTRLFLTEK